MKRLFGAISMLLMLHLTLVGADVVCATHGAAKMPIAGDHMSHHGYPAQSSQRGSQKEKCNTPVSQDCCRALTSCAPTLDPVTLVASRFLPLDTATIAYRVDSPLARVTAPETPPPRA
jgi:hypothetical protein